MLVELRDGRSLQVWSGGDPAGRLVLLLPGCPDSRLVAASEVAEAVLGLILSDRNGEAVEIA